MRLESATDKSPAPLSVRRAARAGLAVLALTVGASIVPDAGRAQEAEVSARVLVTAEREARLSAELAGRIAAIPVDNGDRFQKGDTLVAFACDLHKAALAEARATLDAARATAANLRDLAALRSTGELDVKLAEAEARAAAAGVERQRGLVRRCVLTAPYAGRVVERLAQPHESVAAGAPLLSILDDRSLALELVVPSDWLAWIAVGTPFTVTLDETGTAHAARITGIGARIDAVSQSVPVTGALEDAPAALLAGMSGTATFAPPVTAAETQ